MKAIRPTDINRVPSEIKESLSRDQFRLYQLIWKRFTASRMAKSEYETTTVKLSVGDYVFSFATSRLLFDGLSLHILLQTMQRKKSSLFLKIL